MKKKRLCSSVMAVVLAAALVVTGLPATAAEYSVPANGNPDVIETDFVIETDTEMETEIPQQVVQAGENQFTGNLALGKLVTVSGLEPSMEQLTGDLAVDGNLSTRWSSGIMKNGNAADQKQTPQWLAVDLGTESSEITSINISFFKLVWGQKYQIQTADTDGADAKWKTIEMKVESPSGSRQNPTDSFTFEGGRQVKRYLRIYFEELNTSAGGNAVSVTELEVNGTQDGTGEFQPSSASAALLQVKDMTLSQDDTVLPLPSYENYTVAVKGSEVKNVVALDGTVTSHNIGARTLQVIVEAKNKKNSSDTAEKSISVTVPDKTGLDSNLFPPVSAPNPEPPVIPSLQEWYGYEGQFQLTERSRILICDKNGVDLQKAAQNMQGDLEDFTGIRPEILTVEDDSQVTSADIYIESQTEDIYQTGKEGYYIITDDTGIRIYSSTYTGSLYGTITIEQILWQNPKELLVPCGVIRDYPNYEIRGVMLDIARTPYRLQLLKDYAKILSWYKLNEYHLHINDNVHFDQHYPNYDSITPGTAFHRLESETFPSLKTISKGTTDAAKYFENVYGDPHYTKEEWKELQAGSRDYGVNVLTEIDSPSHAVVYSKYAEDNPDNIPWLGPINRSNNYEQIDLIGPNSERAKRFMTELWEEYTNPEDPAFTNEIVNIGMDEYWDIQNNEKQAMADYIISLHDIAKKNGKTCRMWGQIGLYLDGVVSDEIIESLNDTQLDFWYGPYENLNKRISQGFKLVNVAQNWLYGNPLKDKRDMLNVEYIFENWTPEIMSQATVRKGEPALLGAKTTLWGDVNRKGVIEQDLNTRILPSVAVLSEKTWGGVREDDTYEEYEYKYNRLKEGPGTEIAMDIPSSSSLVADYDFTNLKGQTLYDASGNAYNAEVAGGEVVTEDGVSYLKFDGETKVTTPLKSLSYPYTVSFDLKLGNADVNDKEASLFSGYDGRLQVAGENGSMSINRSFFQQSFGYAVPKNKKVNVMVVGTFQGTKLYINGKLQKFLCRTNRDEFDLTDLASSFVFPLENIGNGFQGYLGNIRFYNRAFSPELAAGQDSQGYVNVAQDSAAVGDSQRKGEGNFDNADKKIRVAWKAVDGDGRNLLGGYSGINSEMDSYWKGGGHADDSLSVDLGEPRNVEKIVIQWEGNGYGNAFRIQASDDGVNWTDVKTIQGNTSDLSTITFPAVQKQYFRMQGISMNGNNAYAIREFEVYEKTDKSALNQVLAQAEKVVTQKKLDFDNVTEANEDLWNAYVAAGALSEMPLAKQSEIDQAASRLSEQLPAEEAVYTASFTSEEQAAGNAPDAQTAKAGEEIVLPENTYSRDGYEFDGWGYQGKTYQPGKTFIMPEEDVDFHAMWKEKTPETDPPQTETDPPQTETNPPQTETNPPQTETNSPQTETNPPQTETNPPAVPAPARVKGLKAGSQKTSSLKLSWKRSANATGYTVEVYNAKTRKWKKVKTTSSNSLTINKLNTATVYKYRVRAYRKTGGKLIQGKNSSTLTTATAPNKPVLRVKRLSAGKVRFSWKKGTKADKLEIYGRIGKGKYSRVAVRSGKTLNYTKSKFKKGKKYTFRMRGYKKVGKSKIYSSYSTVRSIKV